MGPMAQSTMAIHASEAATAGCSSSQVLLSRCLEPTLTHTPGSSTLIACCWVKIWLCSCWLKERLCLRALLVLPGSSSNSSKAPALVYTQRWCWSFAQLAVSVPLSAQSPRLPALCVRCWRQWLSCTAASAPTTPTPFFTGVQDWG